MNRLIRLAVMACVFATGAGAALAQLDDGPHTKVSLIAEGKSVTPGQKLQLGLREEIQPGWHTYWLNPGDSGLPTTIDWTLPAGFKVEPIAWPTPKRIPYGPLVSYGYEGQVVLPGSVDVPADVQPGQSLTLTGHASWLVCSDVCVPEETDI